MHRLLWSQLFFCGNFTFRVHLQTVSTNTCAHSNNGNSLQSAPLSSQYANVSVFLDVAPFGNASNCRRLRQHDAAFTCADLIRVMSPNESCPHRTLAFCLRLDLSLRNQMWNTPRMVTPVDLYSSSRAHFCLRTRPMLQMMAQSRDSPFRY